LFCTVKGLESLGFAKVIHAIGTTWTVEYFDGPSLNGRKTQTVTKTKIVRRILGPNTRIYHHDEATGQWIVGRILQDGEDGAEIRFANRTDVFLKHEDMFVRWKRPIADPVEFLSRAITETPMYAEARSRFLDDYIAQRGATGGISALLSSGIELNPHQIDVIRRVLSDPSQRYLLADEVGLGKTVEAGVIVRQAVLDDPRQHKVVILVPASLVRQWRQELVGRFGLAAYLDISVFVFAHELSGELREALEHATMLVIDEAHHLASAVDRDDSALYEVVREVAVRAERILLLSATPVLRNEAGFLRMLHLIDPVVYGLDDLETFRLKIIHRQTLAEAVAALDPQNALQLEPVLDDLARLLPDDMRLRILLNILKDQIVGIPDEHDPKIMEAIRAVRAHLSETYRLHRRILRNRRKNVKWLTPNRNGSRRCMAQRGGWQRIESALENWRINAVATSSQSDLPSSALVDFYWDSIRALLENPQQFWGLCKACITRLQVDTGHHEATFEGEVELLNACLRLTDDGDNRRHARLDALIEELRGLLARDIKVVVFCSDANIADDVCAYLKGTILRDTTVRHKVVPYEEFEDQTIAWLAFNSNPSIRVIVCDRRAEEGLNLQGGRKAMVHFDLPLDPNRIEQRIGRLDRYGTGIPVESIAILDEDSAMQQVWYATLESGLGVFHRSISSLQYLIEDQLKELKSNLIMDGVDALSDLGRRLGGEDGLVARELRLIDQQDGLDELAPQPETDLDAVTDIDDGWKEIRESTNNWVVETLMFEQMLLPKGASENPIDFPFRFRYRVPGGGGSSTLLPLSGFLDDFLGALDYDAPGSNSRQPLSYAHSYHRKTAIKAKVRPLRYGCEFIEAIKSFSELDDRGRSFGLWRCMRKKLPDDLPRIFFRFSFLVECQLANANAVTAENREREGEGLALVSIRRRADAIFAPFVAHVWIDDDGKEPESGCVESFLSPPYNKNGAMKGYVDTNLRTQRLQYLIENRPDMFGNWSERCVRMRDRALEILLEREEFEQRILAAVERAKFGDEIRFAQLSTRIQHLQGHEAVVERRQLTFEENLSAALIEGIAEPSIRVDVTGFVYLSNEPFLMI